MDLKTAMGAAEHAHEMGHTSYMARAAVVLLDELRRLRAAREQDAESIMSRPAIEGRFAKMLMPAADSSTLGGAS